jgi:PAS domain S-box-containing protein
VSYQPAWDEANEVIGVSVAVTDVTALKKTEAALRESDDLQRHVSRINHQVSWVMDAQGESVKMSSKWVREAAKNTVRFPHMGWLEALKAEDLEPTLKMMKESLRTGEPIDIEYRVLTVDGEWKWLRSRGSPHFGPTGEVLRWYGSVEDIDEHKKAEEALRKGK